MRSPIQTAATGTSELDFLDSLFDRLYPLCRSITGPGLRESLSILGEHLPLELRSLPSGARVFDWTIPQEWRIRDARLTGPDGIVYADFKKTNLSVVNYSRPVNESMSLDALRPFLYSIPELPDAVPYVTSYYKNNWGFCLSQKTLESMPPGDYHCLIDSSFHEGTLDWGQFVLPGETTQEVLLSSYLCHPSLANNELSGPLVMVLLHRRLARRKKRRYTYRFVLAPETIGSLAYLHENGKQLKERLISGLVLTCLGGVGYSLSYKTSRRDNALIDQIVRHLKESGGLTAGIRPFDPTSGSDERQYCSPGFDLPVGQMARACYGDYPGYHNSLDNKEFMGLEPLISSADEIEKLLLTLEYSGVFYNQSPYGEVQLGRRGLYPNTNSRQTWTSSTDSSVDGRLVLNRMLKILNYADGRRTMIEIAAICGCRVNDLVPIIDRLENEGLLASTPPRNSL